MSPKHNLMIIGLLLTAITIMAAVIIFDKDPVAPDKTKRELELEDSLRINQQDRLESRKRQAMLEKANDSLLSLDAKVIYRRDEKIKFIYLTNDPSVLDSIIRASWK